MTGPFHVVKHSHNDEFVTYAVYINNRVYLKPPRNYSLGRQAAYRIARILNANPRSWPEQPMTREELLACGR